MAVRIARATPSPMSSARSTRYAAFANGFAAASWSSSSYSPRCRSTRCRSLDPEIWTIGKQFVVALASETSPLRKPGADTVRHTPGVWVRKPAAAAAFPALASWRKPDVANPGGLRDPREIGDRDADDAVDRADPVELQGIDQQMKSVGQRPRCLGNAFWGQCFLARRSSGGHVTIPFPPRSPPPRPGGFFRPPAPPWRAGR